MSTTLLPTVLLLAAPTALALHLLPQLGVLGPPRSLAGLTSQAGGGRLGEVFRTARWRLGRAEGLFETPSTPRGRRARHLLHRHRQGNPRLSEGGLAPDLLERAVDEIGARGAEAHQRGLALAVDPTERHEVAPIVPTAAPAMIGGVLVENTLGELTLTNHALRSELHPLAVHQICREVRQGPVLALVPTGGHMGGGATARGEGNRDIHPPGRSGRGLHRRPGGRRLGLARRRAHLGGGGGVLHHAARYHDGGGGRLLLEREHLFPVHHESALPAQLREPRLGARGADHRPVIPDEHRHEAGHLGRQRAAEVGAGQPIVPLQQERSQGGVARQQGAPGHRCGTHTARADVLALVRIPHLAGGEEARRADPHRRPPVEGVAAVLPHLPLTGEVVGGGEGRGKIAVGHGGLLCLS